MVKLQLTPVDYIHRTECGEGESSKNVFSFCTSLPPTIAPIPTQVNQRNCLSGHHTSRMSPISRNKKGKGWQKILSGHTKIIKPSLFLVSFHLEEKLVFKPLPVMTSLR